jgi:uncharacterized protein (TIRG00374 family)
LKVVNIIKYLLFVSIGGVLMYLAFRGVNIKKMVTELSAANFWYVLLSLIGATLAFMSRAYRWVLLIEPLGQRPKFSNALYSLMAGYIANMAIPRIGEVTRCTALYEVEKTPITSSFGTVVVERVVDVLTLLSLLLICLAWKYQEIGAFVNEKIFFPVISKFTSAGQHTLFLVISFGGLGLLLLLAIIFRKKMRASKVMKKAIHLWSEVVSGLKTVFNLKHKGAFLFHSVLIWALYLFNTWICFFAISPTSSLSLMVGLFVLVIGGFGMSAPSPGGFGIFHILVASCLTLDAVTGASISYEEGLTFATLVHSSQVLLVLLLGAISLVMLNVTKRKTMKQ